MGRAASEWARRQWWCCEGLERNRCWDPAHRPQCPPRKGVAPQDHVSHSEGVFPPFQQKKKYLLTLLGEPSVFKIFSKHSAQKRLTGESCWEGCVKTLPRLSVCQGVGRTSHPSLRTASPRSSQVHCPGTTERFPQCQVGLREGAPDYARRLHTEEGQDAERDRAMQTERWRQRGR